MPRLPLLLFILHAKGFGAAILCRWIPCLAEFNSLLLLYLAFCSKLGIYLFEALCYERRYCDALQNNWVLLILELNWGSCRTFHAKITISNLFMSAWFGKFHFVLQFWMAVMLCSWVLLTCTAAPNFCMLPQSAIEFFYLLRLLTLITKLKSNCADLHTAATACCHKVFNATEFWLMAISWWWLCISNGKFWKTLLYLFYKILPLNLQRCKLHICIFRWFCMPTKWFACWSILPGAADICMLPRSLCLNEIWFLYYSWCNLILHVTAEFLILRYAAVFS